MDELAQIVCFVITPILFLGFLIFSLLNPQECVTKATIVKLERATDKSCTLTDKCEDSEWLYQLDNGKKERFAKLYYPGEEICIEYK